MVMLLLLYHSHLGFPLVMLLLFICADAVSVGAVAFVVVVSVTLDIFHQ